MKSKVFKLLSFIFNILAGIGDIGLIIYWVKTLIDVKEEENPSSNIYNLIINNYLIVIAIIIIVVSFILACLSILAILKTLKDKNNMISIVNGAFLLEMGLVYIIVTNALKEYGFKMVAVIILFILSIGNLFIQIFREVLINKEKKELNC